MPKILTKVDELPLSVLIAALSFMNEFTCYYISIIYPCLVFVKVNEFVVLFFLNNNFNLYFKKRKLIM